MGKRGTVPERERYHYTPPFDDNYLPHTLSMDNSKRPDLKRKLVVVGDGLSVSLSTRGQVLIVWDAKVAVERLVC